MEKYINLIETMNRFISITNERSKQARDYGSGHLLYQSEIHTIQALGNHGEINASELAEILSVTNGAITQVIAKLVKKGLVEKYKLPDNKKEVYFKLTEEGHIADKGHTLFHKKTYQTVSSYLDQLEVDQVDIINDFFSKMNETLPHE